MLPAASLSSLPSAESHPVLVARTLLYLAHGLQNLHQATFDLSRLDLECTPTAAMHRFLATASRLVANNDELIESLEGLECLVLEGVFHVNSGNLRRAWKVFRRAIGLGQLMGFHLKDHSDLTVLNPATAACPSFIWHRIVSQDRYLSLILNLPSGTADDILEYSDGLDPVDCPMGYLERVHCTIMSRIATIKSPRADDEASIDTRSIDSKLEKAACNMPSDWWEPPSPKGKSIRGKDELEDVLRILFQITHYSLLIYIRLPHMFQSVSMDLHNHDEAACVDASRELLKRYIGFRCMDSVAFCCTLIDFSAFTACIALLLAHLQRWHRDPELGDDRLYRRLSDRDMVQETIELMLELSQQNDDAVLKKKAGVVKSLARMEADAAKHAGLYGDIGVASRRSLPNVSLQVIVPTIGSVSISRNGVSPSRLSENVESQDEARMITTRQQPHQSHPALRLDETDARMQSASGFEFDINSEMAKLPDLCEQEFLQDLDSLDCFGFIYGDEVNLACQYAPTSNPLELEGSGVSDQDQLLSEFLDSLSGA
ncbi:C6 zinc finger domain-containing protein [Fusarium mundagurra]|uniref:C6 zinc finger domain-containing protein n=1 Tax=Fusarium mundagurra TaxID=1567541 RepID=A0A8H5XZ94_9HYPO|nr:C6 zinc finger domain-containing protein [Fusarium mundagurra]